MIDFLDNYIQNISESPNDYYRNLHQATIDSRWDDTTQIYNIKEQVAYPFEDKYIEYEAWIDNVSDALINYSKVYSDFISVFFRDINHKQNYKGQYYKLSLDGVHEETYICYDRMNKLVLPSTFKCVRCNNYLTWLDENGNIIKIPCYLGTDITSTNNLISKKGITPNSRMIILVQANEYTKKIRRNQRFMFSHNTAFKVEEVNDYMQEQGTDGEVTSVKMYVDYSAILPTDNTELNICEYYDTNYEVHINQDDINQVKGFSGNLSCSAKLNGNVVSIETIWESSNDKVVEIAEDGSYTIIGEVGQDAIINCYMADNNNIKDSITITVVEEILDTKEIIVSPYITDIDEGDTVSFDCNVYIEGEKTEDVVNCIVSGIDDNRYYTLTRTENGYDLTNNHLYNKPLTLTFTADSCEDVIMTIKLNGIL